MLLTKLQHSPVVPAGHKPSRPNDAHLLHDALGVLKGRTRPIRTPSTRSVAPPEPALGLTGPDHVVIDQIDEWIQFAVV